MPHLRTPVFGMTRRSVLIGVATTLLLADCQSAAPRSASDDAPAVAPPATPSLSATAESLAVAVSATDNRAVSFTNKRSAFYYTQTHVNDHPEHAHFSGFNIAGRRIFSDYQLLSGGKTLDPRTAAVIVRPGAFIRRHPQGLTETLRLFDYQDVVAVETTGAGGDVALVLVGDMITRASAEGGLDWYTSAGKGGRVTDFIAVGRNKGRFLIAAGPDRASARTLHALYERAAGDRRYTWRVQGQPVVLQLDIVPFATRSFLCDSGDSLIVQQGVQTLVVTHVDASGMEKLRVTLPPDFARQQQQARLDAILAGTDFAEPGLAESHPVMQQTRTRDD